MRACGKIVSISLIAAALSVGCKRDVASERERAAPASQTQALATKTTEAPGVCGPSASESAESCGCQHGQAKAAPGEKPVVPITEAKVGDRTLCPVMNTVFVVLPDSPKVELAGKSYYFCCDGCAKQFQENPKQFIDT